MTCEERNLNESNDALKEAIKSLIEAVQLLKSIEVTIDLISSQISDLNKD